MSEFDDSFALAIGIKNSEIDILNNRYIEFKVYETTHGGNTHSANVKFKKCDVEKDLMKFIKDIKVANYYPNTLCFEDNQ